jgi:fumarylacetoacetase
MMSLNETHNPALKSFVSSANDGVTDFPIQNLPFGIFRRAGSNEEFRGGVAIGDQILDLTAISNLHLLSGPSAQAVQACSKPTLYRYMALGQPAWSALRASISKILSEDSAHEGMMRGCLVPQADAEMSMPVRVGDYTDFYASVHHATNVGKLFRPDQPLLPNYKWVPIAYHGRSSSIGVSGQQLHRPVGQVCGAGQTVPAVQGSKRLDYELEMGMFMGRGNALGTRIAIDDAETLIFGMCLLNDWSARDLQAWEYQPLGPFLAKNFGSTISPWIVSMEALAPYRSPYTRDAADPQPLPYLSSNTNSTSGAFNITLEVQLETTQMREAKQPAHRLSVGNFQEAAYWTPAQMVAHHTINGCNLQPGDLFGSGTMSGPTADSMGSLLEITEGGKKSITLSNGETRTFIEDGDAVVMKAYCQAEGAVRIGFGSCVGRILPALPL